MFVETVFITVLFVCHQDKRPGVGGLNIYFGFHGVLAPEPGYTRGCYLYVKKHKSIFVETVFITNFFV